ncbi:family 16 glycoside hydrolase [Jidongwangia harbinensis]|uniref:family 16 glycoside hydrolase n=1 Tax=Jidongwangia harbinensis TaxID=2878561 RepID=UPI001CD947E3|nr:family 16 glycoside hydrolase [Jidongwangia harbinensis]MCA2217762.1 discoidin domain-containing protein [Jidongwangia harbinensis]
MHRRRYRHALAPIAFLLVLAGAGIPAAPAAAAIPPQEPGVTLRVFDVQVALNNLCTLKPSQTPNVDKLMPTIDFSTDAQFGLANNFVSEVLANVNVTQAGDHAFRLISDDGSRLSIDGRVLIDHDGLHGADPPKDATINLATGYHALRIEHFEAGGDQRITLQWRPPGASSFTLVPNSVLSTDAGVVRVTAPGQKLCEGINDTPGDGLPLAGVHPAYNLTNLRPAGFEPKVTGMDFLSGGRLAVTTWGASEATTGEVWILGNVTGDTGPTRVTTKRVATGLKEPMGIKVVDGSIYVAEKHRLTELVDSNGDEVTDTYRTVATWPFGNNFHEFGFGLLYRDGFFYLNLSVSINLGGATTDPQPAANRGTTVKVNRSNGQISYVAGGLRTPHGIGWGPEDGIFVTDNQGGWLPSSKLLHVKQDRFFNHYMNPAGPFDNRPVTAPVLWMPQNEIANSPSTPLTLTSGPFAGQLAISDVTYGGIQRAYLEKVNGEYQGALFRMTQGLEAGVTELAQGPDGAIYAGGLGAEGNWGQEGKLKFGLQKLTPNGAATFDMLAMRARSNGFEIEYTKPLSDATAAALTGAYKVKQWRYVPTAAYGGPKIDEAALTVRSATLSADRKKVTLAVDGLKAGHVVHLRSPRPFSSADGHSLWSTEAWYTLNAVPGAAAPVNLALGKPATADSSCSAIEGPARAVNGTTTSGNLDKWCSTGATKWLQVDLGAATTVDRFVVKHAGAGGENAAWNTRDFTVAVSTNGTSWTNVATVTGNTASTTTHAVSPVSARYLRLNVTAPTSNSDTAARIYEFEAYGSTGPPPVNLARGKTATADSSCNADENAAKAVNGSVTGGNADKWCSSGASKWLQVDLGQEASLNRFVVKHAGAGGENTAWNTRDFTVAVSTNGTSWTNVATVTGNTASTTTHDVTPVTARHVRLAITAAASSGDNTARIYELEAYGTAGGSNRITLFDGGDLSKWQHAGGGAATWPVADGSAEVLGGDLRTKQSFGDFKLHVEFRIPQLPADVTGQARGNSGIYLQDRYELQVLDSFGDTTPAHDECGGFYQKRAPDSNRATAPETWQTYEITFRAARYNGTTKTENARATVVWNGTVVHNNIEIDGSTGGGAAEGPSVEPIRLQDHGDPGANVRYRNIWIEPVI